MRLPTEWEIQARIDAEMLKQGKMPSVMHMPVEMLTIEEVIERYGGIISEKQIQKLKDGSTNKI